MDSADSAPAQYIVVSTEAVLERHEHMLRQLNHQLAALTQALAQHVPLGSPPTSPPPSPPEAPVPEPPAPQPSTPASLESLERPLPTPEPFSGEFDKCAGFLTQLGLQFRLQRRTYGSDESKIAFFVQLLRGRALTWAQAVLRSDPEITYQDFHSKFKSVFERGTGAAAAAHRLLNLKQGRRSMADYSVEFWMLAEETGWGKPALISTLLNNVCDELKGELLTKELPASLDDVISLCIKVDERLRARRGLRNFNTHKPPGCMEMASSRGTVGGGVLREREDETEGEQPMQLGRFRLSPEERHRRWMAGECFNCGHKGHIAATCQAQPKDRARR